MAKHTTLASLFTDIAAAIRAKTGKTDKLVADDFPTAIASITTGVNTSDATVTAEDIAKGVIAYGANGKVTGNVMTVTTSAAGEADSTTFSASALTFRRVFGYPMLFRANSRFAVRIPVTSLGTAEPSDVPSDRTFTSGASGKMAASGTANVTDGGNELVLARTRIESSGKFLYLYRTFTDSEIFRAGSGIGLALPLNAEDVGDATAADVRKGKTFTSSAGVKVTGTWEGN